MKKQIFSLLLWNLLTGSLVFAAPLEFSLKPHSMGGNNRGFGILAEYPANPEGKIILTRTIRSSELERKPDYGGFPDICSLKIYDPEGKVFRFIDLGEQKKTMQTYEIPLPKGKPGTWRLSVANGLSSDTYRISIPETKIWGVRGEMGLGINGKFPDHAYLYIPSNAEMLIAVVWGDKKANIELFDGDKKIAEPKLSGRRKLVSLTEIPHGKTVRIKLNHMQGAALAFDGVPGLLCPTPEAALKLKGGLINASGLPVQGPIQARIRNTVAGWKPEDFAFELKFPTYDKDNIKNPQLECLLFGKYAPLNGIASAAKHQILDSKSPFYGANTDLKNQKLKDWTRGLHSGVISPFSASCLASAAETPLKLNAAYKNQAIIKRAVIAAFYHLAQLQGDGVLREGDLRTNDYPMTHAFFVYDNLAKALELLKNDLSPEIRSAWTEGIIELGDKIATFQAYESNQWSHVITGHLSVYCATGEKRFLSYFEKLMNDYVSCTFGKNSKHGLHPTGFFLEEYGPDGNYDHLNAYSLAIGYFKYRTLPNADRKLVAKMRDGIQRNLYYKSFHWLPEADPKSELIFTPNAMNCRTNSLVSTPSFPGDYMAGMEFDLGYTRFMMNKQLRAGSGYPGSVFPHLVNSDAWAHDLIRESLKKGPSGFQANDFSGNWTPEVYDIYKLPRKAKIVTLPYQQKKGEWLLPGQFAWKNGKLYGIIFYEIEGANRKQLLNGNMSGGPLGLWTPELGYAMASMRNSKGNSATLADDVTWSGIYGTSANGKFAVSGKEHSDFKWIEKGKRFVITASLRPVKGTLSWEYTILPDGLICNVTLQAPDLKNAILSLPFQKTKNISMSIVKPGSFEYTNGKGSMNLQYPAGLKTELSGELATSHKNIPVQALRIAFPENGTISFTVSVK